MVPTFRSRTCMKKTLTKNAEFFPEPHFENKPFEEFFIEEMPDPAMSIEPEIFQQDSIPFEHSRFPRKKRDHFAEHSEIHSAPLSEEQS